MNTSLFKKPIEHLLLPGLEKLPAISFYSKTRGWSFVIAWIHRIAGIGLVVYLLIHIYTLSFLSEPQIFDAKMRLFGFFFFTLLEWLLCIPVIIHALNGGRLILYEIFGARNEAALLRWMFGLCIIYVMLQAVLMIMGNQSVSPTFFWLVVFILSACLLLLVTTRIWNIDGAIGWKLQRITGALLLIMAPAHLLFMHLQAPIGHEANVVIARMQMGFIKVIDLILVVAALFHAGYGLISIGRDYIESKLIQNGLSFLIILILAVFGWIGVKLIVII
jgi:succinate dehydrogenase hydrophobic membrane anchor protein